MESSDEKALVKRCLQGETEAWNDLFDQHYPATTRFIFQLSRSFTREDAEEISQETFLSVIKSLSSFRSDSHLQSWIFQIASNKARDFLDKRQAAKRGGQNTTLSLDAVHPETGLTLDPPSSLPGPDSALLRAEDKGHILDALHHLGDPCREVIELRYFGDLSYEEISSTLKLNVKTVSSRLSKCLDRLGEIYNRLFPGAKSPSTPSNTP